MKNSPLVTAYAATLYRGLRSPALAVALLLSLAVLAAAGTLLSPPATENTPAMGGAAVSLARIVGLRNTFQSPMFLTLVLLTAINVVACTWHRLSLRLHQRGGRLLMYTDLVLHGSLLLILTGGLAKGLFGFIGTQNVYVGEGTSLVYDWRAQRDTALGFSIKAEELREGFYPIQVRIGARRVATGEKLDVLSVDEGRETHLPGGDLRIDIAGYDAAIGVIRFRIIAGGREREIALATRGGDAATARAGEYDLTLVAFRADLKDVRARITVLESGTAVSAGWLTSNSRIPHRGLNLFLTAWGADAEGKRYFGIQVVRDPGAPFFWVGCVLLALAVPCHFWVKGRRGSSVQRLGGGGQAASFS